MLKENELRQLAKTVTRADRSSKVAYSFGEEKFSYNDLQDTLRNELKAIAGDYNTYRENKNLIFSLIEQSIDDILPEKVMEQYGMFAEIKQIGQGDRAVFTQRITTAAKRRAKQFVTRVGLAGIYEVFKLDGQKLELPATAIGGACQITLEEFLDGRMNWNDLLDLVTEAMDELIYTEIEKALIAASDSVIANNKAVENSFNEAKMDQLIQIADSYGKANIYCTYEFAATMVPSTGWVSDAMRDQKWNNGYFANYKGHNVVVLRQSLVDESNSMKVIDPSYAWIIPSGTDGKPVKIVFEGQTQLLERQNDDWSNDIHTYKKVGIGTMIQNNICVYRNTSLTKEIN